MFNQAYFGFDNYSFAQQNGYARSEFTDWTKSMKGKAGKKVRKPISIFSTFDIDSLFSVVKSVFSEKNTKSFAERNWDVLMIGLAAFAKLSTMGAAGFAYAGTATSIPTIAIAVLGASCVVVAAKAAKYALHYSIKGAKAAYGWFLSLFN